MDEAQKSSAKQQQDHGDQSSNNKEPTLQSHSPRSSDNYDEGII